MNKNPCQAQTKSGNPCNATATVNGFCPIHSDPERAAELGRMSGESRRCPEASIALAAPRTARDVHEALGQVFSEVGAGNISVKLGTSLTYIASVLLKTIEASDHEILLRAIVQMMNSRRSERTQP